MGPLEPGCQDGGGDVGAELSLEAREGPGQTEKQQAPQGRAGAKQLGPEGGGV